MPCRDYYDDSPQHHYPDQSTEALKKQVAFAESALCAALAAGDALGDFVDKNYWDWIDFTQAGISSEDLVNWQINHALLDAQHRKIKNEPKTSTAKGQVDARNMKAELAELQQVNAMLEDQLAAAKAQVYYGEPRKLVAYQLLHDVASNGVGDPELLRTIRDFIEQPATESWNNSVIPDGWKLVPITPSETCISSMAVRYDHGLGIPGYYDEGFQKDPCGHTRRLEATKTTMRQLYEEAIGEGFFKLQTPSK